MPARNTKLIIYLTLVAVGLFLLLECIYRVRETEQVVITQFGKPVGEPKITPGLKLKMPFIQKVDRKSVV